MKRLCSLSLLVSLSFGCSGGPGSEPGDSELSSEELVGSERAAPNSLTATRPSEPRSVTILADHQPWPTALAVDGTHVYWANTGGNGVGGIARVPKAGGATEALYSSSSVPDSVGVDDAFVYFAERLAPGALLRVPRAGGPSEILRNEANQLTWLLGEDVIYFNDVWGGIRSLPKTGGAETPVVSAEVTYGPLHVQGGFIYWLQDVGFGEASRLLRASLSTGAPELVLEEPTPRIFTYAFDAQRVYWMLQVFRPNCRRRCESVHVKSAPLQGGRATVLAVLDSLPLELTVDNSHLYWATSDYPNARLQRIPKHGGKVVTLTSELGVVEDLAVDEQFVYVANHAEQGTIARVPK